MSEIESDKKILPYIFNLTEWLIFAKRSLLLITLCAITFGLWFFPISVMVAPFYSITQSSVPAIKTYDTIVGKTTTKALQSGLQAMLDEGLVTNFIGVRTWIDNKYYEQVGKIEMYRIGIDILENNLARNRGTGGANSHLVQARSDIYADFRIPLFTSYTTRTKQAITQIESYIQTLEADDQKEMNEKNAVFIVNSDNLAVALDKLKQQLQTNLMAKMTVTTQDDKFYRIKGNLIAMDYLLKGINYDFKLKMIDKSAYDENFIPIMELLEKAIAQDHFIITESLGHVSKLEKEANIIAQKLAELRDKLKNG
ncbi:MAG: DUF2333 family protein [Sulfurospirillaceae bacterium]|nr:DUF2333 family protein [Sulfurospirillaceae bacterium]MDD2826729.1 DUF2333 family protein [Sulfurospirillaceae bacterium]